VKKVKKFLVIRLNIRTFAADLVRGGSRKLLHKVTRHAEKPVNN